MKKVVTIILIALTLCAILGSCSDEKWGEAPDITVYAPTGEAVRLSDFYGKGIVLNFWASWCPPCKAEMPNLVKLHKKFKNKGLTVLGINISDQLDAFKQTVKNYGIEYPQMVIPSYAKENGAKIYGVNSIPHIMLIAPDGTILKRGLRGEDMMKYVEEQVTKK